MQLKDQPQSRGKTPEKEDAQLPGRMRDVQTLSDLWGEHRST